MISKAFAALGAAQTPRSPALGTAPGPLRLCLEQRREGEEKTEEEGRRGERRTGRGQEETRDEETTRNTKQDDGEDGGRR